MASRCLGGAELLLQLAHPLLGRGIVPAEEPFPIGIIQAGAQPQPPPPGPGTGQGGLGIEKVAHQAPGPGRSRLLKGGFQDGFPLFQRKFPQQGRGPAHLLSPQGSWGALAEQQLTRRLEISPGFQVARQHFHRGSVHHGAILSPTDRQGELAEAGFLAFGEPSEGQGRPAMIQSSRSGPPLQEEPLHPCRAWSGPMAIQHGQSPMGGTAGEQHLRIGEHHGQGLGGGPHLQEPLPQQAQAQRVVFLEDLDAGLVQLIKVVQLEEGGEGLLAQGKGRPGRSGANRRRWRRNQGSGATKALRLGDLGRRRPGHRSCRLGPGSDGEKGQQGHQAPHGGSHKRGRGDGEWQGGHERGCAPPNLSAAAIPAALLLPLCPVPMVSKVPAQASEALPQAPARILVVGGGARENALAWALARSQGVEEVWVAPGNGGTAEVEGCNQLAIAETDGDGLRQAALAHRIELVVVGPEAPLAAGLADDLRGAGLAVFGPGAEGALLEASKQWAKDLMAEAGVPTAGHWCASSEREALAVLEQQGTPLVVKADGLAAGKGVSVPATLEECRQAIREVFDGRFGAAGTTVVLEERIEGPEVSVFALTDGEQVVLLPPAQDHKRIGEGDTGPNTGGMGAYAPAPLLDWAGLEEARRQVIEPTLAALRARGIAYRGVIYAGLMLTASGLQVIEFNCRFGDPECETLMPLLGPELAAVLLACATGRLAAAPPLTIHPGCSACVIAAAAGYPGPVRGGDALVGRPEPHPQRQLFHAGTRRRPDGRCETSGGRVLAVVAQAEDFDGAFARAYEGLAQVQFEGMQFRRDIGHQVRRQEP